MSWEMVEERWLRECVAKGVAFFIERFPHAYVKCGPEKIVEIVNKRIADSLKKKWKNDEAFRKEVARILCLVHEDVVAISLAPSERHRRAGLKARRLRRYRRTLSRNKRLKRRLLKQAVKKNPAKKLLQVIAMTKEVKHG